MGEKKKEEILRLKVFREKVKSKILSLVFRIYITDKYFSTFKFNFKI
jgi:hypothetical protein